MKLTATLMATLAYTQAIRIEATVDSQISHPFRDISNYLSESANNVSRGY